VPTEYELGLLVGLLIGEGHFGGDGRQPQITLRMHVRHQALFHWLERTFPGGRLYGPYDHSGRRYYQWMARGPYLRDELLPLIESRITPDLDGYGYERLIRMMTRYPGQLHPRSGSHSPPRETDASDAGSDAGSDTTPHTAASGKEGRSSATELVGLEEGGHPNEAGDARSPEPSAPPSRPTRAPQSTLSKAESIFARMRDQDDST
jgi:hypothetical protein